MDLYDVNIFDTSITGYLKPIFPILIILPTLLKNNVAIDFHDEEYFS